MTTLDPMRIAATGALSSAYDQFRAALPVSRVLELGTLRWDVSLPTHHRDELGAGVAEWVLSDVTAGMDVDVTADAHDLAPFADGSFDAVMAVSVWEHLRRPWIAAEAVARVLRPGGLVYVCTHQTFPLHGYPDDYFRFSTHALAGIFADAGIEIDASGYAFPCRILPPKSVTRWNPAADCWLNVDLFGHKP